MNYFIDCWVVLSIKMHHIYHAKNLNLYSEQQLWLLLLVHVVELKMRWLEMEALTLEVVQSTISKT